MIQNLLSVNNIFFTVLNYQMSYLEFFGTIFTGYSVWLAAKNKVLNWPIGIVGTILYGILFYQVQLYSDFIEQIYFFITGFWGWYAWRGISATKNSNKTQELQISYTTKRLNILVIGIIAILTYWLGLLMANIHVLLPTLFPVAAAYAYLDAFTTIMSFVATIYLVKRKVENWYLWIVVDILGIWLYWVKGVVFISLLYVAFLLNAFKGLVGWIKEFRSYARK